MKRSRFLWFIPSLPLIASLLLAACGGPATPAAQVAQPPDPTSVPATSAPPTPAPPTDTPAVPRSTPSPITTPGAAATTTAPPPMPPLECKTGEPWSQTQEGLTLAMCFDPHPPQLGRPVTYEAMIIDAARQPVADASVELTLVGGMAGMEGEHDEDFAVQLASQGSGRYATQATVGPSDLMLTGIRIKVLSGRESWSFSISVDELGPR